MIISGEFVYLTIYGELRKLAASTRSTTGHPDLTSQGKRDSLFRPLSCGVSTAEKQCQTNLALKALWPSEPRQRSQRAFTFFSWPATTASGASSTYRLHAFDGSSVRMHPRSFGWRG